MKRCNIWLIASARPNFVKMAPLYSVLKAQDWCDPKFVYIAQHRSNRLTTDISRPLGVEQFDIEIDIPGNSHFGKRLGDIIASCSDRMLEDAADLVVVPGDVDASLAATIAARRSRIPVAHLEAGLRSYDLEMPEELNRVLIDSISDIWLAPSETAYQHLVQDEAKISANIHNVGNIMIDSVVKVLDPAWDISSVIGSTMNDERPVLVTLHRPSNVDDKEQLGSLLTLLGSIAQKRPVVLPAHPRLQNNLRDFGLSEQAQAIENMQLVDPMGYTDFINLMANCSFILTDSGGIQEEAAYLKKKCFTYRKSTERPLTVECGSNTLVNRWDAWNLISNYIENQQANVVHDIPLWDGLARFRVAQVLYGWWMGAAVD